MIGKLLGMSILNGISLFAVSFFFPSYLTINPFWGFFLAGVILGILNTVVRPIITMFSLPLLFMTLGFSFIIINLGILLLLNFLFTEIFTGIIDFHLLTDFFPLLVVSCVVAIINFVLHQIF